jgi:hypothetical protein
MRAEDLIWLLRKERLPNCKDNVSANDYTRKMSIYDREMHEKLRKMASIEARLAQHENITRLGIVWLTILALAALILFGYHVIHV